jgi:hypothetical protein
VGKDEHPGGATVPLIECKFRDIDFATRSCVAKGNRDKEAKLIVSQIGNFVLNHSRQIKMIQLSRVTGIEIE